MALSREGKKDQPQRLLSCPPSRREFLARCGQGAVAAVIPERWFGALHPQNSPLQTGAIPAGRFHLHPHYRGKLPLESVLLKVEPGHDQFVMEKYVARIESVFAKWSAGLRRDAKHVESIRDALAAGFLGASLKPEQAKTIRSEGGLETRRSSFVQNADLSATAFLQT